MPCPVQLPSTIPSQSRADQWIRYLCGHRRVSAAYLPAIAAHAAAFAEDACWVTDVLRGIVIPDIGTPYTIVDGGAELSGTRCLRLTRHGVLAVEDWLHGGDYFAKIGRFDDERSLLVQLLFGAGCGVPKGHWAHSHGIRRDVLAAITPEWLGIDRLLAAPTRSSLQTRELFARFNRIVSTGLAGTATKVFGFLEMQQAGPMLRWLCAPSEGLQPLIESTRRGRGQEGLGCFGFIEPRAWVPLRALARRSMDVAPERSRVFLELAGGRSSTYRSTVPDLPLSPAAQSQLWDVKRTQQVLAQVMTAHPGCIAMTASTWPITQFPVYVDGHRLEGYPSAVDVVTELGRNSPMIRFTTRIVDGAMWVPGDAENQPSIWIEYEGGRTNSRVRHHIMAALAMSSRWAKDITVIIAVSAEARRSVVFDIQDFVAEKRVAQRATDWPGSRVTVRVIRHDPVSPHCPLHAPPLSQHVLTAPGSPLKFHRQR